LSARPAILFSVLLIVLVPFYLFFDRQYAHQVQVKVERANLLAFDSIDAVTVSRGPESVRFKKTPDGKLYQVISPAGAFVPQDLMSAMTALLIKSREVDVVADSTDDLVQYGLDRPRGELLLEAPGKPGPVKVVFGVENPTRTAVYAKVEGSPKIFLLGLDLKYYQDLMFEWVEGKQGKKAA
jgi:hypothetical protein